MSERQPGYGGGGGVRNELGKNGEILLVNSVFLDQNKAIDLGSTGLMQQRQLRQWLYLSRRVLWNPGSAISCRNYWTSARTISQKQSWPRMLGRGIGVLDIVRPESVWWAVIHCSRFRMIQHLPQTSHQHPWVSYVINRWEGWGSRWWITSWIVTIAHLDLSITDRSEWRKPKPLFSRRRKWWLRSRIVKTQVGRSIRHFFASSFVFFLCEFRLYRD